MLDSLLSVLAPHYCCSCGQAGHLLCLRCIENNTEEPFLHCLNCLRPVNLAGQLCGQCKPPYSKAWACGPHSGALDNLIDEFKFNCSRAGARDIAKLLAHTLPQLSPDTTLVPVPSIKNHIRERGFDHIKLITRHLAKLTGAHLDSKILARRDSSVQRGASAKQRKAQAKNAFLIERKLSPETIYLLIDDVCTTGATLSEAAKKLRSNGAENIWVAVVARQMLSKD